MFIPRAKREARVHTMYLVLKHTSKSLPLLEDKNEQKRPAGSSTAALVRDDSRGEQGGWRRNEVDRRETVSGDRGNRTSWLIQGRGKGNWRMTPDLWPEILFTETGTLQGEQVCRGDERRGKDSILDMLNWRNLGDIQEEVQNNQIRVRCSG